MKKRQVEGVIDIINLYSDAKKVTEPYGDVDFDHTRLTYDQCLGLMGVLADDLPKLKKYGIDNNNIATLALNLNSFVENKFSANKESQQSSLGWYESEKSFGQLLHLQSSFCTNLWYGNTDAMRDDVNNIRNTILIRYPSLDT